MAQLWAKWFYESPAWKHARKAYADTQHGLCERCKAKGLIVKGDIVHHKVYLTQDNITDTAITLCFDCHNKEHNANASIRAGFGFDADGNVRPIG